MQWLTILSALKRNKLGALLIGIQISLTLAIVSNALFIVYQDAQRSSRPTGIEEAELLTLRNTWTGEPQDLLPRVQADLEVLRRLPGVVDAYATNSFPLQGGGSLLDVSLTPDQKHATSLAAPYFVDEHARATLGLHLLSGRWLTADEVRPATEFDEGVPATVVVSQALAETLFPGQDAVGKMFYIQQQPTTVVGVTTAVALPWGSGPYADTYAGHSMFMPALVVARSSSYVVRAAADRSDGVLRDLQRALFNVERGRVIDRVKPFDVVRAEAFRDEHAAIRVLTTVCVLLLTITALGIVGLTQFWVEIRRSQIGLRRALGARRLHIVQYFQIENLLISGAGAIAGVALAVALNLWIVQHFDAARITASFVVTGAALVLVLGQLAVLWPALRAASIPPALATRSE